MQSRVMRQMNSLAERLRRRSGTAIHLVTGERGEREALFHLRKRGYVIVARRWKTAKLWGDVDLIAWDGEYLCFVEVKTRSRRDEIPAESAVDRDKREMLQKMARAYLRRFPEKLRGEIQVRFVWYRYTCYLLEPSSTCTHQHLDGAKQRMKAKSAPHCSGSQS
jgi:putative endonuclease